jgi:hypothetical protein
MIFFYTKWSILNAPTHVDFKAPIDIKRVKITFRRLSGVSLQSVASLRRGYYNSDQEENASGCTVTKQR